MLFIVIISRLSSIIKMLFIWKAKSNFLTRFANLSFMELIEHELVSLFPHFHQIELEMIFKAKLVLSSFKHTQQPKNFSIVVHEILLKIFRMKFLNNEAFGKDFHSKKLLIACEAWVLTFLIWNFDFGWFLGAVSHERCASRY